MSNEDLEQMWKGFMSRQKKETKLSSADFTRTLVQNAKTGMLSVLSAQENIQGFPFGAIVNYAADEDGKPVLSLSDLSAHTKGVKRDGRVSLVVPENPVINLRIPRVTVTGTMEMIETETERLRELFMKKNPNSIYTNFADFHWYKMTEVESVLFVMDSATGTARSGRVDGGDYMNATPDPVALFSVPVCAHMNTPTHTQDNLALAEAHAGFEMDSVKFLRVDRLGLDLDCFKEQIGAFTCRVSFNNTAMDRSELKERVIEVTNEAHEATGHKHKKSTST